MFIGGLGVGAFGLLIPALGWATTRAGSFVVPAATTGKNPYRLAMHVHSSFSEGVGSNVRPARGGGPDRHDLVFFTVARLAEKGLDHLTSSITRPLLSYVT